MAVPPDETLSLRRRATRAAREADGRVTMTTTSALEPTLSLSPAPTSGRGPGLVSWYGESFSDRLGDRLLLFDNRGPGLELLRFHQQLGADPAFEAALRGRVNALAAFTHPAFVRLRSVTWLDDPQPRLALVSEIAEGERLAAILAAARRAGTRIDCGSAIWLLRQLLAALGALHAAAPGVHHGLLTPDRVVLGRGGRLAVTEYVLGDTVRWLDGVDSARTPASHDVVEAARIGAGVLLGRNVARESSFELFQALGDVGQDRQASALRTWFARVWCAEGKGFDSAAAAGAALDDLLPDARVSWSQPAPVRESARSLPPPPTHEPGPAAPLEDTVAWRVRDIAAPLALRTRGLRAWTSASPTVRRLSVACGALALLALGEAVALMVMTPRPSRPAESRALSAASMVPVPVASDSTMATPTPASHTPSPPVQATARVPHPVMAAGAPRPAAGGAAAEAPHAIIGWVQVDTPFEVRVYANGRLLGSGLSQRYRLPEGRHIITMASDEHGVQSSQPVDILPGKTVLVALDAPPR